MAGPTINRWAGQAAQDAMLKFAPQRTSLAEALQTAKETYGQTVQAGNSTATLTKQATERAKPAIGQIYSKANSAQQAGVTLLNKDLAGLPGVANQYKADQAGEVQQQLANLLGARSRDESMLHQQGVAAQEGAQFNQLTARQALQKTVAGLISKSNTTSQEQGSFAATEAEKLAHEAETLEQRETASKRTAGTSEANSKRTASTSEANSKRSQAGAEARDLRKYGTGGGVKPLSTAQQNSGAGLIAQIRHYAGELGGGTTPRAELVQLLSEGQPQSSHARVVTINGKQVTEHIPVPKIPSFKPDVLMSAGVDLAEKGSLSASTWSRLEKAGYNAGSLGFKKYQEPSYGQSRALHSRAHTG